MIRLRLITLLFLFIMPVILFFSVAQIYINWSEFNNWSAQLTQGVRDVNRSRALQLSTDPIFNYYFSDLDRQADSLYLTSHINEIETIFRQQMQVNSLYADEHLPVVLAVYDRDANVTVTVGDVGNDHSELVDKLMASESAYLEQAGGARQQLVFPLGLDRNNDGQLTGNERLGAFLAEYQISNVRYQQLASGHLRDELVRTIVFTLVLIVVIFTAARYLARPIEQLMHKVGENSQGNPWQPLKADTPVVEINRLGEQLNRLNAELKRKNIEVRESRDSALRSADAKGAFMAAISHELRTPINGIVGFTDLLQRENLNAVQKGYLEKIAISATSLHGLIDDVLDYSRIQSGHLQVDSGDFDLLAVMEDAMAIVSQDAKAKGLTLLRLYPSQLPVMMRGDRKRVFQVLLNLLNNSVKFTESGTILLCVESTPRQWADGEVVFSVRDTGVGIEASQLETIFEPFVQSDSSIQRRFGGTGLGLSICKQLIERMGGEIHITSQLHVGTTVQVVLRFAESEQLRPELPGITLTPGFKCLLGLFDPVTSEAADNGFRLAGFEPEIFQHTAGLLQRARQCALTGEQVLICLAASRRQVNRINKLIDGIADLSYDLGGKMAIILLSTSLESDDLIKGHGCSNLQVLDSWVSRRELIAAANRSYQPLAQGAVPARTVNQIERLSGYSVLIVDDNEINLLLARDVLRSYGAETCTVGDGLGAINLAKGREFDLILMDLQMPGMSGVEAARCIRGLEAYADTVIIALTANVTEEGYAACMEAGMNAVVTKPFDAEELVALIESAVSQSGVQAS